MVKQAHDDNVQKLYKNHNDTLSWHPLCSTCKNLFESLRKELTDVIGLTKEKLAAKIRSICKSLSGTLMDKVCKEISKKAVDMLYDLIKDVDKKIDPQDCCETIHFC
ncbi:unnamed protein product [Bursaphelenchus okinawaensis]|uniref:Saposin B-type domain-containing protein n=1 Tax=Bursaphelenchus okinawaensis TaxID=465554 RepID=A0A811L3D5_9BILA|nr:unnamed protein product [Bursaphelenchus okinawaensis]CAG9116710.1 unnamed protein product [Bursaphelenchus okinawaensis]